MNKKKGLPQWLRDALNKKEKEKQKKLEKEKGKKDSDGESDEEGSLSKDKTKSEASKVWTKFLIFLIFSIIYIYI